MQECRVCGLLFLGGGACPSCGSQVAMDITVDDIVMDDETIPGLEEIADAIGDAAIDVDKSDVLPFGLGAKAEVIESSLPFGVGSFTSEVNEVAIPYSNSDVDSEGSEEPSQTDSDKAAPAIIEQTASVENSETMVSIDVVDEKDAQSFESNVGIATVQVESNLEDDIEIHVDSNADTSEPTPSLIEPKHEMNEDESIEGLNSIEPVVSETQRFEADYPTTNVVDHGESVAESVLAEGVPDMWKIDAAEVDMDAIYSQEEQIIEVTFEDEMDSDDVQVSFDDFHHSPVEDSMASDEDAPALHPAKAIAVESSGQPEISGMITSAFEFMANSSWMQAAQILSTASNNRPNDPAILNNLGLALLQSALEMDSKNDPMSSSQYEAAIMALRQGAKVDSNNNTILLNLSHALLVSGRAEKAMKVIDVVRGREPNNVEVENTLGACLIQLGRDEEAQSVLAPFSSDNIVAGNLSLI